MLPHSVSWRSSSRLFSPIHRFRSPQRRKGLEPLVEVLELRSLLSGGASNAVLQAYGQLPMRFELNQGQTDAQVSYLARGSGYAVFLTPTEAVMTLQAAPSAPADGGSGGAQPTAASVLSMQFAGANPQPQIVGLDQLSGTTNYLTGSDLSQWHTGI